MLNFDFYNPTRIVFGKDRLKELNKLIPVECLCNNQECPHNNRECRRLTQTECQFRSRALPHNLELSDRSLECKGSNNREWLVSLRHNSNRM